MANTMRPRVFIDINIGSEPAGRVVIELFVDQVPKTCENFRILCTQSPPDLSYKLSPFHRIIDEFMIQGGDITHGNGTGGKSIYGESFPVENLEWRSIDKEGLVCMASRGDGTNSSQFWITLAPSSHMDGKDTVFGQVVSGKDTLRRIAEVSTDDDDRPIQSVIIAHCGELERRKIAATGSNRNSAYVQAESRGRPDYRRSYSKRSNSHSRSSPTLDKQGNSSSRGPSPHRRADGPRKRPRRRSDHSIDENLRGRARQRSRDQTKTPSPIAEEPRSPRQPERARSREPSRSPRGHRPRSPNGYRRRPSLPNNYERWKKHSHHYDDEDRLRYEEQEREGGEDRYAGAFTEGRLDGAAFGDYGGGGEIKFKGRGSMKYREKKQHSRR